MQDIFPSIGNKAGSSAKPKASAAIPLLARIWHEDDVWNVSAFDLPIVAYSDSLEAARTNFAEAVQSHFDALQSLQRLESVLASLRHLAAERGFYETRVTPNVLVENFLFDPAQKLAA